MFGAVERAALADLLQNIGATRSLLSCTALVGICRIDEQAVGLACRLCGKRLALYLLVYQSFLSRELLSMPGHGIPE